LTSTTNKHLVDTVLKASLVLAISIAAAVGAPTPASAYCNGNQGIFVQSNYGAETIRGTTCDGQKDYFGKTIDNVLDGYCYYFDYDRAPIAGVKNCRNSVWENYSFIDNDSASDIRACRYHPGNGTIEACGTWSTSTGY
jgi:hypothetical protein